MAALLIGRTTVAERVWDVSRAIDAVAKYFPQADSRRVVCVGNSGGGTTAFYAACLDKRICVAVLSCSVCTFEIQSLPWSIAHVIIFRRSDFILTWGIWQGL